MTFIYKYVIIYSRLPRRSSALPLTAPPHIECMKMAICHKQIMATLLLQQLVQSLYEKKPNASLLHADIEDRETKSDSVNTHLYFNGSFIVKLGAVKVELGVSAMFVKSEHPDLHKKLAEWSLNSCSVREPASGDQLQMVMHEQKPHVWTRDGKRGEFLALIGAM